MGSDLKPRAGLNQVFVCASCSRTFADRAAAEPVAVEMDDATVHAAKATPHPRYPDDQSLATTDWVESHDQTVKIPGLPAIACCAAHAVLCDSRRIRFNKGLDGAVVIAGAGRIKEQP